MDIEEQLPLLLNACAAGDRQAFNKLYHLSSPYVYAVLIRLLKQQDKADDILQEVYVKIWDFAHEYQQKKGSALAWMRTIARYKAIDQLRRDKKNLNNVSLDEEILSSAEEHLMQDGQIDQIALMGEAQALSDCLDDMKDGPKNSIQMAFYEGYTHEELSQKLKKPLGTVKSWVRRGLQFLKECLDNE